MIHDLKCCLYYILRDFVITFIEMKNLHMVSSFKTFLTPQRKLWNYLVSLLIYPCQTSALSITTD